MRKGVCIGVAVVLGVLGVLVTGTAIAAEGPEEIRELRQRLRAERQEGLFAPLASETVGARPVPQVVTPPGSYALSIDGDFALGGFVFKDGYPFLHNDGGPSADNTALGLNALVSSTPGVPNTFSGESNTAIGDSALRNNTEGFGNSASGASALYSNTTGSYNTASGAYALFSNTEGFVNTASGAFALYSNTTGSYNTASGAYTLKNNITGTRNIALGYFAGFVNTIGSNNIWIGHYGNGSSESNTLRIGKGTGTGAFEQERAFISGIRGATGTFDQDVCTNSLDQLGPCAVSSLRFKEDIQEMAEASEGVFGLRPVRFRYKQEFSGEGERAVQYGLIAEEVAELYPQLVTYDPEGRPVTVRYHALTPLLLNELQKQQRLNATQEGLLREQSAVLTEFRARLARLEAAETARGRPVKTARR